MSKSLRTVLPALAMMLLARSAAAAPLFSEQWENDTAQWTVLQGGAIVVNTDTNAATRKFQHETEGVGGGKIQSTAIAVTENTQYCMSAWIRGGANTCPFIGLNTNVSQRWLVGQTNYGDGYGGVVTPVVPDGAWHWYTKQFTTSAGETTLRVIDELWSGCTVDYADFDAIEISAGACPAAPRIAYDDTVFCANPKPVATVANACVACTADNGNAAATSCGTTTNPFCAAGGTCGKCAAAADCATRTGKFCSPSTGACVAACEADNQCAANQWCSGAGAGAVCTAKTANGQAAPGGTCALGARACESGACDATTNTCGIGAGKSPCANDAQCTVGVCIVSSSGADGGDAGDGGSVGTCRACRTTANCSGGQVCNTTTNECVNGGDGGGGTSDGGGGGTSDGGGSGGGGTSDGGGSGGGGGDGDGTGDGDDTPSTTDGGSTEGGGCGCHSASSDSAFGGVAAVVIGLLVASRRRRRDVH